MAPGAKLAEKLWGSKQDLLRTTDFISDTIYKSEAEILGMQKKKNGEFGVARWLSG